MKTQEQIFDATVVAELMPLTKNFDNCGAFYTVQTQFTGAIPTYSIQANLGMVDTVPKIETTPSGSGNIIIDPDGWADLPVPIMEAASGMGFTTNLTVPILTGFDFPIFAIRMKIITGASSASTGKFKVLQQGIR